jgi:hypothetical protein
LLDCSNVLTQKLQSQGFDVESGTAGFCTGVRHLPSQIYEKDIFIYNPSYVQKSSEKDIANISPEYNIQYLQPAINRGATVLIFVNRVSEKIEEQNAAYSWIPYMPLISFTKDKTVDANGFSRYPASDYRFFAPLVGKDQLSIPVLQKLSPPKPQDYPCDVFHLFWNGHGDTLGVLILRGKGELIILPQFRSNDEVISTFLNRVVPKMYPSSTKVGLVDKCASPAEEKHKEEINKLQLLGRQIEEQLEKAREELAGSQRAKNNVIKADDTANQILTYYDTALKQDDVALFYLYKVIESIENKYGGEAQGIKSLGCSSEWKSVKRIANESYRDVRHAPKPGDVIKKWSDADIKTCFQATEKVVLAYFASLFTTSQTIESPSPTS